MRDHKKLKVFQQADDLVVAVYRSTDDFPKHEWYGLRSQIRRTAVSVPTNIVEGCARRTKKEFLHFLSISLGSATELRYLLELTGRLEMYTSPETLKACDENVRTLAGLIRSVSDEIEQADELKADGLTG